MVPTSVQLRGISKVELDRLRACVFLLDDCTPIMDLTENKTYTGLACS